MTREEEEARLVEIEAQSGTSANFKAWVRASMERRWRLQDAGIPDLMQIKVERMVKAVAEAMWNSRD